MKPLVIIDFPISSGKSGQDVIYGFISYRYTYSCFGVLNGSYKTEEISRHEYRGFAEARTGWETYWAWYRSERLHQSLDYLSPLEFAKRAEKSILLLA